MQSVCNFSDRKFIGLALHTPKFFKVDMISLECTIRNDPEWKILEMHDIKFTAVDTHNVVSVWLY